MRLIPVAEARPDEARGRGPRSTLQNEVLAVEEIGRVFRVRFLRREARKRRKRGIRPLPAVAAELVDAPWAHAVGMRADGNGRPVGKIKIAMAPRRRFTSPCVRLDRSIGPAKSRALVLRFGEK